MKVARACELRCELPSLIHPDSRSGTRSLAVIGPSSSRALLTEVGKLFRLRLFLVVVLERCEDGIGVGASSAEADEEVDCDRLRLSGTAEVVIDLVDLLVG